MKNEWVKQVEDFQMAFENPKQHYKNTNELMKHRLELIREEFNEYEEATNAFEKSVTREQARAALVEMLDALADMTVINIGTANLLGMDIDEAMRRVHESNMSKLGEDGKPIYDEKGKVRKGPNYHKPRNLLECISAARAINWADTLEQAKKPKEEPKARRRKILCIVLR